MANNRVTVAMAVYNGMPHVQEAVESILNQTYENLELVIIDDGSTDGTTDYLATIEDPRVVLSPNPQNLGIQGAWQRAIGMAERSPYFKLMCADDLIFSHAIATEVAILDSHPDVVMTASRRTIVDDDGKTLIKARGLNTLSGEVNGLKAIQRSIAWGTNILGEPPSVLLRSDALKEVQLDATHKLCIDFDMWAQVLKKGNMYAIKEPLAAFRVGVLSDSLSTVKKHRAMQIGEFNKLAADPQMEINKPTLYAGVTMAVAQTTARSLFYKGLEIRDRFTKN